MKEFLSYMRAAAGCMAAAVVAVTVRYCLFAPEQIGQLLRLFA